MKGFVKIVAIVIVSILVGFFSKTALDYFQELNVKKKIEKEIVDLYNLLFPQVRFTVENIKSENGMYKVLLKGTDNSYREVFVSNNGNILTETVIYVKQSIESITRMKDFVDCLDSKGVKVYGMIQSNNTDINQLTLLQLNILGRYSPKIYFSCEGENLNVCIQKGITSLPAVIYQDKVYEGVKTVDFFSNITGCKV